MCAGPATTLWHWANGAKRWRVFAAKFEVPRGEWPQREAVCRERARITVLLQKALLGTLFFFSRADLWISFCLLLSYLLFFIGFSQETRQGARLWFCGFIPRAPFSCFAPQIHLNLFYHFGGSGERVCSLSSSYVVHCGVAVQYWCSWRGVELTLERGNKWNRASSAIVGHISGLWLLRLRWKAFVKQVFFFEG